MAGWFEIDKSTNDKFKFVLKAGNGEIILSSQMYEAKSGAQNGIESVQVNSQQEAQFAKETSTNDKPYFNLVAANHQIIGTSQMYSSTSARDNGIRSVMENGSSDDIRDLTLS